MTTQSDYDRAVEAARNAPRLDNNLRATRETGARNQAGGTPSGPGRASPIGGPAVAEHIGAVNDRPASPPDSPRDTVANPSRRVTP